MFVNQEQPFINKNVHCKFQNPCLSSSPEELYDVYTTRTEDIQNM